MWCWMIPKQVEVEKMQLPGVRGFHGAVFWDWIRWSLGWKNHPFWPKPLTTWGRGISWLDSWLAASKWIFCDFIFQGYTLSMICFICMLTRHLYWWYGGYKKRSKSYSHHLPWSSNNVRVTLKLKYWAMKSSSFLVSGPFLGGGIIYLDWLKVIMYFPW